MLHLLSLVNYGKPVCKLSLITASFFVTIAVLFSLHRRFSVLVEYHKQYGVSFIALKDVMKTIKESYSKLSDDDQSKPLWVCTLECSYIKC